MPIILDIQFVLPIHYGFVLPIQFMGKIENERNPHVKC